MQQPETSKKCPVCRKSIDPNDKENEGNMNPHALTDEERRVERLRRHLVTLKSMKIKYISSLVGLLKEKFRDIGIDDLTSILNENFENFVLLSFSENEDKKLSLTVDRKSKIGQEKLDRLSQEVVNILVNSKNFEANFSIPKVKEKNENYDFLKEKLFKEKLDILTHLNRIYRARKHLDATAARNYFEFFGKEDRDKNN